MFALDYMTSKCQAKARSCAKRMRAGSSTNLSGGLFRGIDILQQALQTGAATPGGGAASTTADAFAVLVPAVAQSLPRAAVTALEAAWNLQDAAGSLASRRLTPLGKQCILHRLQVRVAVHQTRLSPAAADKMLGGLDHPKNFPEPAGQGTAA